jgi:hypothetical protein
MLHKVRQSLLEALQDCDKALVKTRTLDECEMDEEEFVHFVRVANVYLSKHGSQAMLSDHTPLPTDRTVVLSRFCVLARQPDRHDLFGSTLDAEDLLSALLAFQRQHPDRPVMQVGFNDMSG